MLPYLPVYMRQAGLTPVEAGLIYGAMPFFGAVARPIFGAIADKLHKHKVVLIICMVMSGEYFLSLILLNLSACQRL